LEAITKHPSPPPCSRSSSQESFRENTSDHRPIGNDNANLLRALEEGNIDTSLDLRGSQEHLLGKMHQTRWYLPSSSMEFDNTPVVKKSAELDMDLKVKDTDALLASRMKRGCLFTHRSPPYLRQRSNLSMDSFLPPHDEVEIPDTAARLICSIERVNEACLNEDFQSEVPPPTPNLTPPTCELTSKQLTDNSGSILSGAEQKELSVILFNLLRDVQEMRTDLQSLTTEVSSLKQQQQMTRPNQILLSDNNPQYPLKSNIMKPASVLSPSNSCFLPGHSSVDSISSEEGWKAPDSGTPETSKTHGVTTSPQSRCVTFSLPEKPKRNHKEKQVHKSETIRDTGEMSSDLVETPFSPASSISSDFTRK
uniref:SCHIP-1 domain-containing protein n=1 Tax=Rodentolepis nana TaxID=102285 RepID=A0A0R3TXE8_RODNA